MIAPFELLFRYRKLIWQTTINDIKAKFAGSMFGKLWLLLYPMLMLSAYAGVYIYIFKVRFDLFNSNEYVLLIFCGLIPFLGFCEALGTGIPSVTANSNLIKNTLFPIDIIPIKSVLVSQCTQVVGMIILLIALAVFDRLTIWALLIIPIWLLQLMFTIGLIWILSSLNVFFKDIQNMIAILTLFLMMVSPIAYTVEMVPKNLQPFLAGNPLFYIITAYQESLMLGKYPHGNTMVVLAILGFVFFIIGYWFFSKLKKILADNV
ncbi:ABC transporter [Desulforamulus ferrireducens]|uniref:Transport permease protein n=1 Tax=Desulforamulus ferrireducens TaxID=1833852 RepID=A0A1S6J0W2_9FIRM|nr:ABC transporter [Desulforamulus ferrireducens]